MKGKKPTSISDLLDKSTGLLEQLRRGSAKADRVLQAVREELPDGLGAHVWGAAVRDGTLTVLVDSAAWATRIRYRAPELKESAARRLGTAIERVLVRARPAGAGGPT